MQTSVDIQALNEKIYIESAFIEHLSPEDRFEVMTFNVAPNPLFQELRALLAIVLCMKVM